MLIKPTLSFEQQPKVYTQMTFQRFYKVVSDIVHVRHHRLHYLYYNVSQRRICVMRPHKADTKDQQTHTDKLFMMLTLIGFSLLV